MIKRKYKTKFLWNDLIAIGKANGLSDEEIIDKLIAIEESFGIPSESNVMFTLLRKKGIIKCQTTN